MHHLGETLLQLSGKPRPDPYDDFVLSHLGCASFLSTATMRLKRVGQSRATCRPVLDLFFTDFLQTHSTFLCATFLRTADQYRGANEPMALSSLRLLGGGCWCRLDGQWGVLRLEQQSLGFCQRKFTSNTAVHINHSALDGSFLRR